MSEFEKWFMDQEFYTNMRFIHGDALFAKDGDVYRVLPVQMTHVAWVEKQSEIDQLKHINDEQNKNLANAFKTIEIQQRFDEDSQGAIAHLTEMNQRYIGKMQEQQDMIAELKAEKAGVQKRFNFLLNKNICNEADHASLKLRVAGLLSKWKKDSEHADSVASEDFVQNVLDACIDDLEKTLRGEHE